MTILLRTLAAALLSLMAWPTSATSFVTPYSYVVPTADGRHVFVMLSPAYGPNEGEDTLQDPDADVYRREYAAERQRIRKAYSRSGLYRNDGSTTPLWTVDWYAYDVEPHSDAVHLVRHQPAEPSKYRDGVSFYASGALLRSYDGWNDLTTSPGFGFLYPRGEYWRAGYYLDEKRGRYWIINLHWEQYLFDVTTGEILWTSSPVRRSKAAAIAVLIGGLGFLLWRWRRYSRRQAHD